VQASRGDVIGGLKESGRSTGGSLRRWSSGKALVTGQIALALVLVAGAAVFGRSLARILAQDTGLDAANVLIVAPTTAAVGYKDAAPAAFAEQLLERLRAP